ncbi:MAG TPA: type I polyketide synthase [Micromonosporaceae bacterium]
MTRIAVVGMACRYPDAASPAELWENAVTCRRAFRRLPDVRMRLADYWHPDPATPDRFYARNAAVIEGYEFDRIRYLVGGSTYRSTDLTHWLALDVAAGALADAGFPMAEGLPRERTAVVVGNSLTGEFSRANLLRLRWPYVRRTVAAALAERDFDGDRLAEFLDDLEARYKRPFPVIDEDTLAGGLANTIAGRICNYFDLKGGGYTVDGACSSSLLSVATACTSLVNGDCDVALAGGVDLSIDPFEIIGFAKTGALARREMRVYDRGSNGFWPGEGCGMVVLMREADARRAGHRRYATVAGWGISSDGKGGMTRPELDGYRLALRRAYRRAGFGIETVPLFEGHGTGTEVGDATELTALSRARRTADPQAPPAAISSVKSMIGHTKAAAGVAGLIKATMALHNRVLPPAIGCVDPHPVLSENPVALRVLRKAEPWPADAALRAGVTAMGFGGINTHVVLEKRSRSRRGARFDRHTARLAASPQDAELLLVAGGSPGELAERLDELVRFVPGLSYAELGDLATALARDKRRDLRHRAAVVASSPDQAEQRLRRVRDALAAGEAVGADGCFLGHAPSGCRIGYLFPGQGSGRGTSGGALRRRFPEVEQWYASAALPSTGDMVATAVAQPRIVTGSVAGLRVLSGLGLTATVAVGHSLGEISALHWAGAMDQETLLRVAGVRGRTMTDHSGAGTMASVAAPPERVRDLLADLPLVVAGYNGPQQTVVAGPVSAVEALCRRADATGLESAKLAVSHAFHSPLVAPAAEAFGEWLAGQRFGRVRRRVISTVTGEPLPPDTGIPALLCRQITDPVRFAEAVTQAAREVDLFVEVGPGRVLTGLASRLTDVPVIPLDTDDESVNGLLRVLAASYVNGATLAVTDFFDSRFTRPLRVGEEHRFLASPCEQAPDIDTSGGQGADASAGGTPQAGGTPRAGTATGQPAEATVDLLRRLAAERVELPLDAVLPESRLLDDLHLSSITVGQVVNQAARQLGIAPSQTPTSFATATVRELAEALEQVNRIAPGTGPAVAPAAGAASWVRPFRVDLDEVPLPSRLEPEADGVWQVYGDADNPLAEPLRRALERAGVGGGVLVCLPLGCDQSDLTFALRGAQAAIRQPPGARFVLVYHDRGAAGLAKTLRQEAARLRVTIVRLPASPDAVDRVVAEVAATASYSDVVYDVAGVRRAPILRAMPVNPAREQSPLDASDVLLVTGGGKGITAECALAVAADTGARLAVLGRSDPERDAELAANLRRIADAGLTVHYERADVTDPGQVRDAVAALTRRLGPVTAVLHGAGRNEPRALADLDPDEFDRTFAPKIGGLRAVLDAVDPARLRLLVTFGSIIGRAGLPGEAHYATANEWLADLTREVAESHPGCRAMCVEWSVWSGVGMGERLAVVESLTRSGVTPVTPDQGVRIMRRLVADPDTPVLVVVSGRADGVETLHHDHPPLPLLRFLGRPLVRYHGVELVTEVELNPDTDPYLAEHRLDGNLLFPAVLGMEAMAQVAVGATGREVVPVFERVEFSRPIVITPQGRATVRIAATVTGEDTVDVVVHSAETGFAAEHFRARLRLDGVPVPEGPPDQVSDDLPSVPLRPESDLYGDSLFQGRRFQRLRRYRRVAARHVDVDLTEPDSGAWFAGFLPGHLLLGDPGTRDALMHGNQVCVPDATLLPAGIDRVYPGGDKLTAAGQLRYCATERDRDGDTYVYDIAVRTNDGAVVERWEGLRLRAVRKRDGRGPWVAPLLGPYLERRVEDLLDARVTVVVEPSGDAGPRAATALAVSRALGRRVEVSYRPDGRPEVPGDQTVSASHGAGMTMCVAAAGIVACDVEPVVARPEAEWRDLLGPHAQLARLVDGQLGEGIDTAASRVWLAVECLQKAGLPVPAPLTGAVPERPGWQVFASGAVRIATFVTALRDVPGPVGFAVLTDGWS